MPPARRTSLIRYADPRGEQLRSRWATTPTPLSRATILANYTLNFLERGWNGENFHEVTENLRTSDRKHGHGRLHDYRRAQADLQKLYGDREKAQMS